jgi:1,4-alpha-glucan branching enzyme
MIKQDLSPHPDRVRVTFTIPCSIWADSIHLVGDFNNWNRESHPLVQQENEWSITLELERDREYRYRYLFNGADWCNDSNADKYVPNRYGGEDSVVIT